MNILTIGGLDPSGCAGIAADLKAATAFRAHGLAVITAITAQNTVRVAGVYPVAPEIIEAQIESIVSDIDIHAVKIGLVADIKNLQLLRSLCDEYRFSNVVVDPVLRSTTNYEFGGSDLVRAYHELFSVADVITPNLHEASLLTGRPVEDVNSMKQAALLLHKTGAKNVVVTGGHLATNPTEVWYDGENFQIFEGAKIENAKTRGLGCVFSTILAVHLANNQTLEMAISSAKHFISDALRHPLNVGHGKGPLNFAFHG